VLWASGLGPARGLRGALGQTLDAVVLDAHAGLSPERLAIAEGLVRGGGALVLRLPPECAAPDPLGQAALCVEPFTAQDVGTRWWRRLERACGAAWIERAHADTLPLIPPAFAPTGTPEQAQVIEALIAHLSGEPGVRTVLIAERGRGKSSALGAALAQLHARAPAPLCCVVTAPTLEAAREVLRFAAPAPVEFVALDALDGLSTAPDILVVDEAAQLPVPALTALCARWPEARLAFATTTRGYEGTGRGFVLRFLASLRQAEPPPRELSLTAPIRWAVDDPLEAWTRALLLFEAEPAQLEAAGERPERARAHVLDRDALVASPQTLSALFGLLVHAHYRTTPDDLVRLLDAPNLTIHALSLGDALVGACVIAVEGGLTAERCAALARGEGRLRGHALADTLMTQAGCVEAGTLRLARSVRIAVHPAVRRAGLASRLVEHVHAHHADVDAFGTVFGATAEVVRFRQRCGYHAVRVGVSAGARSGEPSVVMVRCNTPRAAQVLAPLRPRLARALPLQRALMQAEGHWHADDALSAVLSDALAAPAPLTQDTVAEAVAFYAGGAAPYEGWAAWVRPWVEAHAHLLDALDPRAAAVIRARVLAALPWRQVAHLVGLPGVPAAQRALRPAVRALLAQADLTPSSRSRTPS